jgi:hypothetical protein
MVLFTQGMREMLKEDDSLISKDKNLSKEEGNDENALKQR